MSANAAQAAEFPQHRQISKLATNKAILDFTDAMGKDPKRSKVVINLVDYAKTPHVARKHFLNPDMANWPWARI